MDNYPAPVPPQVIDLTRPRSAACSASTFPAAEVERVLTALQFQVEPDGDDAWTVTTPQTRLDIQAGAADLIEELARVYGYDKLPERCLPLDCRSRRATARWNSKSASATCSPTRACRRRSRTR